MILTFVVVKGMFPSRSLWPYCSLSARRYQARESISSLVTRVTHLADDGTHSVGSPLGTAVGWRSGCVIPSPSNSCLRHWSFGAPLCVSLIYSLHRKIFPSYRTRLDSVACLPLGKADTSVSVPPVSVKSWPGVEDQRARMMMEKRVEDAVEGEEQQLQLPLPRSRAKSRPSKRQSQGSRMKRTER